MCVLRVSWQQRYSGVRSRAAGGLDGDDRSQRACERTNNQQRLPVSRRDTQWAAWCHRKRGHTAVQWERDQAHPFDIHKRTHLHDTDRFWSHRPLQIHQNPSLLLTSELTSQDFTPVYHASDHMTDLKTKLIWNILGFSLWFFPCGQTDFHIKQEMWSFCLSVMD